MAIDYEVRDGIAYISFCRPEKHNALRDEDIADLIQALHRLDREDDALIGILSGQGRSFSSGADVKQRLQGSVNEGDASARTNETDVFFRSQNWKPIIAAVHGYCLGHALGTALHCDIVVAARNAVFQATEIVIGLPSSGIWRSLSGQPGFANEVCLTGRMFSAEEAWGAGMLGRLVDEGEHLAAAEQIARQIISNPQAGVREQIRLRRSLISEETARMRGMTGGFRWLADAESRNKVAEKEKMVTRH
jgi:enoyl-CoA hydratase/carnithine racemase